MIKARLLEYYERVIDAPDAIKKLRSLILDLAVRGKLAPQDPNERAFKTLRNLENLAKGNKPSQEESSNDPYANELGAKEPFFLPSSWRWVRFGDVQDVVRGVAYSKADVSDISTDRHLPILRAHNIGTGLNFDNLTFVDHRRIADTQMLRRGDFLIAMSSGSKLLVGKAAYVADDYEGAFGAFCGVIRVCYPELGPFVGIYLASSLYRSAISASSRGIGINNLKKESLMRLPFPLPPLAEQNRIVAKVDESMAICAAIEEKRMNREFARDRFSAVTLARVNAPDDDPLAFTEHAHFAIQSLDVLTARPDQVKELRETILHLAVRGKLVSQDPNDETACKILEQISARNFRRSVQQTKVIKPPFYVPDNWAWTRLGYIGAWGSGSTPSRGGSHFYGGDITWLKSGELNDNQQITGSEELITEHALNTGSFRRNQIGDVLVAMYGATIGKLAILAEDAVTNQAVCGCSPCPGVFNRFLFLFLLSQRTILRSLSEGGAQPNISKAKIIELPFPLPPFAEQKRIVEKVDVLMALCSRLETSLSSTDTLRISVLNSLIAELY